MNYLAHLYLSGEQEHLMIGNFIADHVKGKQIELINDSILKGIMMHRAIDEFTDSHPVVLQTKERLRPTQGKYSPVIADVFMDHFLACDFENYSSTSLPQFAKNTYQLLKENEAQLPDRTRHMLKYMERDNWLTAYSTLQGMDMILKQMSRRVNFPSDMENAAADLERDYILYKSDYDIFFPELQEFCKKFTTRV